MIKVGKFNKLEVIRETDFGYFLDGGTGGDSDDILLPFSSAPKDLKVGDIVDVFICLDSEDRIIATTTTPFVQVGEFALLRVSAVEKVGAFMDWGLPKELLVPFREQRIHLEKGRSYIVRVYVDEQSDRIVASAKVDKFISDDMPRYHTGQAVDLLIAQKTDLGFKAIVDNTYYGLLFESDIFQPLDVGQKLKGYIKAIRPDGKIDLSLAEQGFQKVGGIEGKILDLLKAKGGFLPITAKTSPDIISSLFGVSKKSYKKALGGIYKKHLITIDPDGIRLVK